MATTPMTLTVNVNGAAATAGTDGLYAAKPGDTIEVVPNQNADWTSASGTADAVTLRNADISPTRWKAQIVNTTTAASNFTVSAKASANAALTKSAVFRIAGGDARNAQYRVYATNGSKQTLALDFDTMSYTMTDDAGTAASDTFAVDSTVANGYLFKSSRITSTVNTARFRLADNTVVGAFPFAQAGSTTAFAVQPFIASKALVTTQAELAGTYNRLGINLTATTRDSNIRQVAVTAGGAQVLMCDEVAITAVANCPASSVRTYNVTPASAPTDWRITNVANPADTGVFSIARIGGENVYLSAGAAAIGAPGEVVFRVGVRQQDAWPSSTAIASDTNGTWGTLNLDASSYATGFIRPDGSNGTLGLTVSQIGAPAALNIRVAPLGGSSGAYFLVQSGKIAAVVGARGPQGGYMQFGLID
ncbi:hypothetical protein [Variovorax soli]|uniref:hypothetical protein n=1 Tax=Variovorax soli TaxID=376815 RepID=UPI00286C03A0|nr:hypothetical protein [Variovorax soli]